MIRTEDAKEYNRRGIAANASARSIKQQTHTTDVSQFVLCVRNNVGKNLSQVLLTTHRTQAERGWPLSSAISPTQSGRGRCVSLFLDKNRRHIGKSQPQRSPQST
eukprot:COSAG01_NODE_5312_length_4341_cov_18.144036_7_plen_105_part_00